MKISFCSNTPNLVRAWKWTLGWLLLAAFTAFPAIAQTQLYDAKLARVDIYRNMATAGQYEMILYYENTGTEIWSEQDQVRLAIFPIPGLLPANRWGTSGRLLLSEEIHPGGFATFTFTATAPVQSGRFTLLAQMIKESPPNAFGFGEVLEESIEVNDMSQAIVVDGDRFLEGSFGREWIPVGATIGPWYTEFSEACDLQSLGPDQKIWCEFEEGDTALAMANYEQAFQELARQGVNTVRSGFVGELFETSIGQFNTNYCTHFNWTLDKAAEYGIRMIFSMSAPSRLQSLYNTQFCGTGASDVDCAGQLFPTALKSVILDQAVRDFTIERVWNFIGQCNLLDRPEIFSYRLFDEPHVPSDADRNRDFLVQLWHDHVIDTFGSLGNAFVAWGFSFINPPPQTCGNAGNLLCPPGPSDFCVEQTGPMANLSREYRRFFDVAYLDAYDDVIQALSDTANPQCTGPCPCEPSGCPPQRALMSASFPSDIYVSPNSPASPSHACEGTGAFNTEKGQWADPGWASQVFDYVALNVADWREGVDWPVLKLWIDYVRGGKPVVLHEFGRRGDAPGGLWEQWQVSLDQTRAAKDRHANGGQIHFHRDFQGFGGPAYGTKDIDGCARPVFDAFPQLMERLLTARDTVNLETGAPLVIDPYSKVLLTNSILEALGDHQSRSAGGIVPIQRLPQIP